MNNAVQVITTLPIDEVSAMLYESKIAPIDAPVVQPESGHTVFAVSAEDYEDLVSIPDDMLINASTID